MDACAFLKNHIPDEIKHSRLPLNIKKLHLKSNFEEAFEQSNIMLTSNITCWVHFSYEERTTKIVEITH